MMIVSMLGMVGLAHAGGPTMKPGESKTWSMKNGVTVTHTRHVFMPAYTRVVSNASGDRKTTTGVRKGGGTMTMKEWTQPSGRKLSFVVSKNPVLGNVSFLKDAKSGKSIKVTLTPTQP